MIAIADINTLWRSKPFEALASLTPVLGLAPRDIRAAWRTNKVCGTTSWNSRFTSKTVTLPPGWASVLAPLSCRYLWRVLRTTERNSGKRLRGLVLTSPHYLALARLAAKTLPTFYYCSDDYSQYAGWGGEAILETEAKLTALVRHSFFVSQSLANRAIHHYGANSTKVTVSPNATDNSFLEVVTEESVQALLKRYPQLKRPLVGVVGGINERLDLATIAACAARPEVGSLVMIGPVDAGFAQEGLKHLQGSAKCVFIGNQPHQTLPSWMQALDVALIPYRDTLLNRACSPMRLFDHLAAGRPIVATAACAQIHDFAPPVQIAQDSAEAAALVAVACQRGVDSPLRETLTALAQANTWTVRAKSLLNVMTTGDA